MRTRPCLVVFLILCTLLAGCTGKKSQAKDLPQPPAQNQQNATPPARNSSSVIYENQQYGFNFTLPASWRGFTIAEDRWQGIAAGEPGGEKTVAAGPQISIRHPAWTEQNPRQDIPIMVFTVSQWDALQQDEFHIGAAPVGPKELGRNTRYVFALPARYNYAFLPGYEEVDQILQGNPLHTFESGVKK